MRPISGLLLVIVHLFSLSARAATEVASDSDVRFVLILSRHGVRAPLDSQQDFGRFSAEAWPKWEVAPGEITPHGKEQMKLMGAYYRERYIKEGLLSGEPAKDAPAIYLRANADQRTIETARSLGIALAPGSDLEVHARAPGTVDPLFRAVMVPIGHPDYELGIAAVLGRIGGDLHNLEGSNRAAFDTLEKILVGEDGHVPDGKTALLNAPANIQRGQRDNLVQINGPIRASGSMIDVLMLEYANGFPLQEVGWGRATSERIVQLLPLHSLWFDLSHGTPECARVEGSNVTSHIVATIEQAATGIANPAAIGQVGQKMVVIAAHDTTQIHVGSNLGLTWWLPGTYRNPVLLCGALVFELRERRSDHQLFVRAYYTSPSLQQMRDLTSLSLDHPPLTAPIFIPNCSEATRGYEAPVAKFLAHAKAVIDPSFVDPNPN
jgi:4-phytase / acid phosphatase